MKKLYYLLLVFCGLLTMLPASAKKKFASEKYVVLASTAVRDDAEWMKAVNALQERHRAEVFYYEKSPREVEDALKAAYPRYVAVVEKPENLGRDFVIDFHKMSREMDDDIYEDFLWGIITGYEASDALRMVENAAESLVIKDAVSSITELASAKWFDHYGWVDDHERHIWGEKKGPGEPVVKDSIPVDAIHTFSELYKKYDPDLIVTAFHASEGNLVMPFFEGTFDCKDGKIIAHPYSGGDQPWELKAGDKRRVYLPIGNCLIGNVNNTRESMAIAWMRSANLGAFVGYVVPTWHGRAGWGGLKYWLTTPGRYRLAEAFFLNQQDLLHQQYRWYPSLYQKDYPHGQYGDGDWMTPMKEALGREPSHDERGFWHDRDVLAYYGDPAWNVRLQEVPGETDYTVKSKVKGGQCVITITTDEDFNLQRMKGDGWKSEHVLDLPFSYFFPERLNNPRLAEGQDWDVALDENFLLIYNCDFEPGNTYQVILDIDK